ncbi:MAG: RNA polymerase sigma factor, partial [Planctomycetia bacterium]|nr:RNA polymerase sigma factor [Planctomycetia bacterium]
VLARKASSIGQGDSVACWLYKVAYRVALRLRASAAKVPPSGEPTDEHPAPELTHDADWRDLRPVLDDEIARLPEKYRAPFVLCYLEGRTNEEAAEQLGCPKGTVLSRLARGRERLRERLTRRGLAFTAPALALTLSRNAASAAMPSSLVHATTTAAVPFAAGTAASELIPPHIAALTDGVLRTMTTTNIKIAASTLLMLAVLGTGIGWAASGNNTDAPTSPEPVVALVTTPLDAAPVLAPQERPVPAAQPDRRAGLVGKVVDVAKDGKSFTLEVPPTMRGGVATKVVVKIGEKTSVTYNGVVPNGAKPTEGYSAQVRLEDGSKELAAEVLFLGTETGARAPQPQATGTVVEIGKDGQSITLQLQNIRGQPPVKTNPIKIDNKTVLVFNNVSPGGAKLTKDYQARIWFGDDRTTASMVQLTGSAAQPMRGGPAPNITGKVVGIAK